MTFQSPGLSPALGGQADGNITALSPTLHNRKSHRGKIPNVKPPVISGTAGTIKKYLPCTLARLFPGYPRRWGGGGVDTNDWCIKSTGKNLVTILPIKLNLHRLYIAINQPLSVFTWLELEPLSQLQTMVPDDVYAGFTSRKRIIRYICYRKATRPVLAKVNLSHHVMVTIGCRLRTCVMCSAYKIRIFQAVPWIPFGSDGQVETFKCSVCDIPL